MRPHIPKVDTGEDYDFMCGTSAFGATVATRDVCQSCVKRTLEIVDLLAQACDELKAIAREDAHLNSFPAARRRAKLLRRIDKALGKRPIVEHAKVTSCRFGCQMCTCPRCMNPGCGMDL